MDFHLFNFECLAQRWEPQAPLRHRSRWLFSKGPVGKHGWAVQLGPFHFMACRMVRA